MTSPVPGQKFLEALAKAGIISVNDHIRRVIIDASVDSAVIMYVERFGDERLMSVAMGQNGGYVIRYVPFEPAEAAT